MNNSIMTQDELQIREEQKNKEFFGEQKYSTFVDVKYLQKGRFGKLTEEDLDLDVSDYNP